MLAEWKLGGWAEMMGRAPGPDDLIVPLPPGVAERRTKRKGEPFRTTCYTGKCWRKDDLPALGWRHRRHYDMRATDLQKPEPIRHPHVELMRSAHLVKSWSVASRVH